MGRVGHADLIEVLFAKKYFCCCLKSPVDHQLSANLSILFIKCTIYSKLWLTYQKNEGHSVRERNVENIKFTRSPNTKLEKPLTSHRESVVMIPNKWVSVDRPSQYFTKRLKQPVRLCFVWNVRNARQRSN